MPDLEDKDVKEATVKIQSVFRGYKIRKECGTMKPVSIESVSTALGMAGDLKKRGRLNKTAAPSTSID